MASESGFTAGSEQVSEPGIGEIPEYAEDEVDGAAQQMCTVLKGDIDIFLAADRFIRNAFFDVLWEQDERARIELATAMRNAEDQKSKMSARLAGVINQYLVEHLDVSPDTGIRCANDLVNFSFRDRTGLLLLANLLADAVVKLRASSDAPLRVCEHGEKASDKLVTAMMTAEDHISNMAMIAAGAINQYLIKLPDVPPDTVIQLIRSRVESSLHDLTGFSLLKNLIVDAVERLREASNG